MQTQQTRSKKDFGVIVLKGMGMGAADIVPGVSGGTIALITGIYDELLYSLKSLTPEKLLVLMKQGPIRFWQAINGSFLLAVFVGILISVKTLATAVAWALEHHPLFIWGAFSGLIAASLFVLFRQNKVFGNAINILLFALGAAIVIGLALMAPTQLPVTWWMLFFGGFVAISAMILPGISGSFILLLVGLYPALLEAVTELKIALLLSFLCGCLLGLLSFSRFLSWLLSRFYSATLSLMLGFLLGSLYVTWPWKYALVTIVDRHGELVPLVQKNVWPSSYAALTGESAQLAGVILCVLTGALVVLMTEFGHVLKSSLTQKK